MLEICTRWPQECFGDVFPNVLVSINLGTVSATHSEMVPHIAVYCPFAAVFHACCESFRRPYIGKLLVLPPQWLLGYSEVTASIHRFWDRLMEEEVLSDGSLNMTVWDVRGVICHSCNRIFFPREILVLDDVGRRRPDVFGLLIYFRPSFNVCLNTCIKS